MRAGNLDRIIELQRRTTGLDLYGTPVETWTTFATMRAQKLENATTDREGTRGNTTDTTISFRIRWLGNVTLENRVTYEGNQYTIGRIIEIGRRVGLDIVCGRIRGNQ
jgi:SPP1 family predicted phage head-tail adaptor